MNTGTSARGAALAEAFGDATLAVRARILLVGGDAALRVSVQSGLAEFQVDWVAGAEEAADRVRQGLPFDVVLVDAERPGPEDALAVVRTLRRCGRPAPAVLLADPAGGVGLAERALAAGFADVVAMTSGWTGAPELGSRLLRLVKSQAAVALPAGGEQRPVVALERLPAGVPSPLAGRLDESLRSLEAAHERLQRHSEDLERVLRASTELRAAAFPQDLADRVLGVLADLPGFSLVAVGLVDADRARTEVSGLALRLRQKPVPLGRRTILLDLFALSPEHQRVGVSRVVDGWSVSVKGERAPVGEEWDLSDLFDGTPVALTPIRGAGRFHGFLLLKASSRRDRLDASRLGVVETLANVAGLSFDVLRLQAGARRKAEWAELLSRLGRELVGATEPQRVLSLAVNALQVVLAGVNVTLETVRSRAPGGPPRGFFASGRILLPPQGPDAPRGPFVPAAELVVPVRAGGELRALLRVSAVSANVFADVDEAAVTAFGALVGKALSSAEAHAAERRAVERLRLVSDVGRLVAARVGIPALLESSVQRLVGDSLDEVEIELFAPGEGPGQLCVGSRSGVVRSRVDVAPAGVEREAATARGPLPGRAELHALSIPLRVGESTIGELRVRRQRAPFAPDDLVALSSAADHLANALRIARLFEELVDRNRELRESERNKSEFLAVVAHDLRTPLTSVRSAAEILLTHVEEPAEVRAEFLSVIRDESVRLGRLVDGFVANSSLEHGLLACHLDEVLLPPLVAAATGPFAGPADRAHLALSVELPDDLPTLLADGERVTQVLTNLLSNAIRYTPNGGSVTVRAVHEPSFGAEIPGRVRVDVTDTGPGIEENQRDTIFQRFRGAEGRRGRGGAGLGIPVARTLVEHMGGSLWHAPRAGGGTVFSFTLPIFQRGTDARGG